MSKARWYKAQVMALVEEAMEKNGTNIALAIEARAKKNIQENDQILTGFMLNSVYVVSRTADTYSQAKTAANARNPKADMGNKAPLKQGALAAVAVGALYAIHQEERKSFLFAAAMETAKDLDAIVEPMT